MIVKIKFYDTLEGLSHSIGLFRKEEFVKFLEIPKKSGEMIGIMKKISQCNFTKINHEFCVLKLRTKKAKIAEIAKNSVVI